MITFSSPLTYGPGIILRLLKESYAEMISMDPSFWKREEQFWAKYDHDVFQNPDSIGTCTFVSLIGKTVIGMGSFDPRQCPDHGIIGHNCVLPLYRGKGYGKKQIEEICSQLRIRGCTKASVSTGDHRFYIPAQRMYLACGFREIRRNVEWIRPNPHFKMIEYEKEL
jgi:GNAT superfamily N-acetyltransferase